MIFQRAVTLPNRRRFRGCLLVPVVMAGLAPQAVQAEGLGWRLPASGTAGAEDVQAATNTGWALPASSKSIPDAMGKRVDGPADRPQKPLFSGAAAVVTGFSGHEYGRPVLPEDQRAAARLNPDYQVIDLDGPVVTLTDIEGYGHAMNGDEVTRAAEDTLYARQIGQVFGAVMDDEVAPSLYLSATSAYGLQIVGPDANGDTLADRRSTGDAEARWMDGQWGHDPLSGPRHHLARGWEDRTGGCLRQPDRRGARQSGAWAWAIWPLTAPTISFLRQTLLPA